MSQNSVTACNDALDARNALLNGGTLEIRSGAPADIDSAPTGTVLATFTIGSPAFAAASGRSSTANAISAVTATADGTGTPYHYVGYTSGAAVVCNGTAGTSGTAMILSAGTWSTGYDISITSWTTTMSKGTN